MKAEERKEQILRAARSAFAEHGYERTSIAVICRKAGIARPTLYQYFKDKRSVFRELLEGGLKGLHDRLHQGLKPEPGDPDLSARQEMEAVHLALLKELAANRELMTILLKEAKAKNAETEDIVSRLWEGLIGKLVEEHSRDGAARGMSEAEVEFMIRYMHGGMLHTAEHYLFGREPSLSVEDMAAKLTDIEARIKGI